MKNADKAKLRERLRKAGWTDASMMVAGTKLELWKPNFGGPGELAPMGLELALLFLNDYENQQKKRNKP